VCDHHGLETRFTCNFDSRRKKWTFSSGLLLCQRFRRRCEETAWKRRRIETGLVIVIVMSHVFTHVVSYKLFGDWICVVQFVSQEHGFDKRFVIWHFPNYCLEQIVSLWSLSIWVRIVFTTLVEGSYTGQHDKISCSGWICTSERVLTRFQYTTCIHVTGPHKINQDSPSPQTVLLCNILHSVGPTLRSGGRFYARWRGMNFSQLHVLKKICDEVQFQHVPHPAFVKVMQTIEYLNASFLPCDFELFVTDLENLALFANKWKILFQSVYVAFECTVFQQFSTTQQNNTSRSVIQEQGFDICNSMSDAGIFATMCQICNKKLLHRFLGIATVIRTAVLRPIFSIPGNIMRLQRLIFTPGVDLVRTKYSQSMGASDIVKAESSGEDPRATGGLVSNLPHPRVNKTKQHLNAEASQSRRRPAPEMHFFGG